MTKETVKTEGSNEAKAHAEAQATAKRLETATDPNKPGDTPNTVDETAAKKANEIRSEADKLQEKVDSANSQADALLKTPAKPVAGSPVTAGTASDTDTGAAAKATEGNFSTKTVAGNGATVIADPDNPKKDLGDKDNVAKTVDDDEDHIPEIPDDETPVPTDDELDAIDLTERKASSESLSKVSKLVRDLKNSGTPDNFTIYGYGGTIITLEDLDNLLD